MAEQDKGKTVGKRGGRRPGAGRPKKAVTLVKFSLCLYPDQLKRFKALGGKKWLIEQMAKAGGDIEKAEADKR